MESGRIVGLSGEDLDLDATLSSGQVFRWRRDESGLWSGVLGARAVFLRQSDDFTRLTWQATGPDAGAAVRAFLRLDDVDLPLLAREWRDRDPLFAETWARQPGVRVLRQNPDECFFSFLCASVAPIARISRMLGAVADALGTPVCDGLTAFPTAAQIAAADEQRLRALGLGFRARRVIEAAQTVAATRPPGWLDELRQTSSHAGAKRELLGFFGVGEKIADCICLFALDKDGAIPVDTHIWRIAQTHYAPRELAGKSLTPANYARAVAAFHSRFGAQYAGWAQQTLFYRAAVGGRR